MRGNGDRRQTSGDQHGLFHFVFLSFSGGEIALYVINLALFRH
jgi:hypothetical protein